MKTKWLSPITQKEANKLSALSSETTITDILWSTDVLLSTDVRPLQTCDDWLMIENTKKTDSLHFTRRQHVIPSNMKIVSHDFIYIIMSTIISLMCLVFSNLCENINHKKHSIHKEATKIRDNLKPSLNHILIKQ